MGKLKTPAPHADFSHSSPLNEQAHSGGSEYAGNRQLLGHSDGRDALSQSARTRSDTGSTGFHESQAFDTLSGHIITPMGEGLDGGLGVTGPVQAKKGDEPGNDIVRAVNRQSHADKFDSLHNMFLRIGINHDISDNRNSHVHDQKETFLEDGEEAAFETLLENINNDFENATYQADDEALISEDTRQNTFAFKDAIFHKMSSLATSVYDKYNNVKPGSKEEYEAITSPEMMEYSSYNSLLNEINHSNNNVIQGKSLHDLLQEADKDLGSSTRPEDKELFTKRYFAKQLMNRNVEVKHKGNSHYWVFQNEEEAAQMNDEAVRKNNLRFIGNKPPREKSFWEKLMFWK